MQELLAKSGATIKSFFRGQKVNAKLVRLTERAAFFDIGGKSEGVVADADFSEAREFLKNLKPGETILVSVIAPETPDGTTLLSVRNTIVDASWDELEKARKEGKAISVICRGVNPAGVTVDVHGLTGFIPTSHLGKEAAKNAQSLIGKSIKAKIIEINKGKNKVVLSERAVSEAGDIKATQDALKKIKEGEIYDGVVKGVSSFGAFVEIKAGKTSLEGLVHVSELSWEKIENPMNVIKEGDKLKVKVLGLRDGKLALSAKHARKDPWESVSDKYKVEDKINGEVMRVSDFGVFVQLEPGIEGLIHVTKIPPTSKLSIGQKVDCYIEEINPKSHKISLGLVLTSKPVGYK